MKKVIFLNAPPRAGKDAIGKAICEIEKDAKVFKFANVLKNTAHAMVGITGTHPEYFETTKGKPSYQLGINPETGTNYTPREWYIFVSENMIKPALGEKFFGESLLNEIKSGWDSQIALITDSGFAPEAAPIIEHFGIENCLMVRIHRSSCSFIGDSRSFWDIEGLDEVTINNNELGQGALVNIAEKLLERIKMEKEDATA